MKFKEYLREEKFKVGDIIKHKRLNKGKGEIVFIDGMEYHVKWDKSPKTVEKIRNIDDYLKESVKPTPEVQEMLDKLGLYLKKPFKRGLDGKMVDSIYDGVGTKSGDIKTIKSFFPDFKIDFEDAYSLSGHSKNGLFTYSYAEGDADVHLLKNKNDLMKELKLVADFNKEYK